MSRIDFWERLLNEDTLRPKHSVAIIDGHHYIIEDEFSTSSFRGFGGRKFQILFDDGYSVATTNLWYQGEIPQEFGIKNNAKFKEDLKWKRIGSCDYLGK